MEKVMMREKVNPKNLPSGDHCGLYLSN